MSVLTLVPYVALGVVLWFLVLRSGVHATVAGVALALTIPLRASPGIAHDLEASPLHRLEHALHGVVAFGIVPIFGFANAGVSLAGMGLATLAQPLTLGIALGLFVRQARRRLRYDPGLPSAFDWQTRLPMREPVISWRVCPVRYRFHDEPVHRPARLSRQSGNSGRRESRHSCRIAGRGCRRNHHSVVGAAARAGRGLGVRRSALSPSPRQALWSDRWRQKPPIGRQRPSSRRAAIRPAPCRPSTPENRRAGWSRAGYAAQTSS